MQVQSPNLALYGGWGLLLLGCGLFSTVKVSDTVELWNSRRSRADAHQQHLTAIERNREIDQAEIQAKAEIDQAHIDNKIQPFDSVRITNYLCDPHQKPQGIDWTAYADEDRKVVTDRTGRIIGYTENGAFAFMPENCSLPGIAI